MRARFRWGRRPRGQALVEFAIVVPILMLLLAGIIQFGVILWGQNTLNQVVRDAGRYAATLQTCDSAPGGAANQRIASLATASGGPWTLVSSSVAYDGNCPPSDNGVVSWVKVQASADVAIFFPFVPTGGRISSSTDFRVEPAP